MYQPMGGTRTVFHVKVPESVFGVMVLRNAQHAMGPENLLVMNAIPARVQGNAMFVKGQVNVVGVTFDR